ncbi:SCO family protein [Bacillus sp. RG28]|uniref:SCO family protein n=1 Tax=Gottfriedia endophytica TaxID=2820819 RepID=A0A940NPF5_9BACI|nr:SCO family protein [Gottfriedia endophytica]MBP0724537.1 SCO family protein [Gottfriedia endophytica]
MNKFYIIIFSCIFSLIGIGVYYFGFYQKDTSYFPKNITLVDDQDHSFSLTGQPKKYRLVEFVYLNCADICPSTTYKMEKLRDHLQAKKVFPSKIEFITMTIDPKRDNTNQLQKYAQTFQMHKTNGWHILRGSEKDTKKITEKLQFMYRDAGGGMLVHTTQTYLIDPKGNVVDRFGMGENGFKTNDVQNQILKTVQ